MGEGFRYSYDMLGEAALTAADAERYFAIYEERSTRSARRAAAADLRRPGHLDQALGAASALQAAQRERVMAELLPRREARWRCWRARYDIGLNIDAEEADRLELSLDLFERAALDPALAGWDGFGFAVQAYQKRARS